MSYEPYYFSERTVFFSHNKSINSAFSHGFLAKRSDLSVLAFAEVSCPVALVLQAAGSSVWWHEKQQHSCSCSPVVLCIDQATAKSEVNLHTAVMAVDAKMQPERGRVDPRCNPCYVQSPKFRGRICGVIVAVLRTDNRAYLIVIQGAFSCRNPYLHSV